MTLRAEKIDLGVPAKMVAPGLLAVSLTVSALLGCPAARGSTLGTVEQRDKEELVLRLKKAAPMQDEIKKVEELYRGDSLADTPDGKATVHRAVDSLATAAAQYAANEDADRPQVMWAVNGPHKWFGFEMPRSGYGIDNPDNIYRMMPISGAARYEIRGKVGKVGPAQETFVLYSSIPGVGEAMNKEGRMIELAGLQLDKMQVNSDGTFVISVDSEPANGRANHMQTQSDNPHMHLLVRDTLADWSTQSPVALDIRRLSGPPVRPAESEPQMAARARDILAAMGPYWLSWTKRILYSKPVNEVMTPWRRATNWGFTAYGNFSLAKDEAWVLTASSLGAAYLGFQLADPWGVSLDYVTSTSSMTQAQARPNADGTYTYVVAAEDPGVYNWIDTGGLNAGTFQFRWQALPASVTTAAEGIRSVKVVKLATLKSVLPADTKFATAEERKAQLKAREASYNRLLAN
jgi:hypothetical protein